MGAFIKFNKGMLKMPFHWQLWLLLLVSVNLIVPLFFIDRLEAQVVVGTLLASMMLMTLLTARYGFTRILGLGHILWVPLLYFLWTRLGDVPTDDVFAIWIRVLMTLNAISLVRHTQLLLHGCHQLLVLIWIAPHQSHYAVHVLVAHQVHPD